MKNWSIICVILSALLIFSVSIEAKETQNKVKKKPDCHLISSKTAMKQAVKQTGGKVVSIKFIEEGRKSKYRVRLLVGEKRIKNITIKACK